LAMAVILSILFLFPLLNWWCYISESRSDEFPLFCNCDLTMRYWWLASIAWLYC
jgi:hypothetical protein